MDPIEFKTISHELTDGIYVSGIWGDSERMNPPILVNPGVTESVNGSLKKSNNVIRLMGAGSDRFEVYLSFTEEDKSDKLYKVEIYGHSQKQSLHVAGNQFNIKINSRKTVTFEAKDTTSFQITQNLIAIPADKNSWRDTA